MSIKEELRARERVEGVCERMTWMRDGLQISCWVKTEMKMLEGGRDRWGTMKKW